MSLNSFFQKIQLSILFHTMTIISLTYIASTGTYIEKDLSINEEIEKYRLKTTASLLSGRKDIIVFHLSAVFME